MNNESETGTPHESEVFRPGQSVAGRGRYSTGPLPRYSYVPGFHPHPVSDPAGHLHGETHEAPPPLDPEHWQHSETYLHAIDLFNHGYYWESHEAWESLWHVAGRRGPIADWLKALIKLAAAAVKMREGNATGVRRHSRRASELLRTARPSGGVFAGLDTRAILDYLDRQATDLHEFAANPNRLLPLVLTTTSKPE